MFDYMVYVVYFVFGIFENNGLCLVFYFVKILQFFFEVIWDIFKFNVKDLWFEDGSQLFVWSQGDEIGFGNYGDYVFGWKDNVL